MAAQGHSGALSSANSSEAVQHFLAAGAAGDAVDEAAACHLFGIMLDGGMADLELGAVWAMLAARPATLDVLVGLHRAVEQRVFALGDPVAGAPVVVLPSYAGPRDAPNLTALVALMLARLGVRVLVHGELHGEGTVATAYVLRELGVLPSVTPDAVHAQLEEKGVAFMPVRCLSPGLADMLALRQRLGFDCPARIVARTLDPLGTERALRVVGTASEADAALVCELVQATDGRAIVFRGSGGEPFVDPLHRPRIELAGPEGIDTLFHEEPGISHGRAGVPGASSAVATAAWIRRVLAGEIPLPLPIVNQLACCLYGSGYVRDFNQAKAIVALKAGGMAAA